MSGVKRHEQLEPPACGNLALCSDEPVAWQAQNDRVVMVVALEFGGA